MTLAVQPTLEAVCVRCGVNMTSDTAFLTHLDSLLIHDEGTKLPEHISRLNCEIGTGHVLGRYFIILALVEI